MLLAGVLCGWEDRGMDAPHRSSRCSGWHHHLPRGFWGGGCSCQMCTPAPGWEFGMYSQDASHRGNSHVKKGPNRSKLGAGACLLARPCCSPASLSLGIPSKKKNIYIYKIKIYFIYIYLSLSYLSMDTSPHPSPRELGPCAQLRSCRPVVKRF